MLTYTAPEKKNDNTPPPERRRSSQREKKGWMQMINVMSSLQGKDIYLKRKKKVKYTRVYHKERKEKGIGRVDRNNAESLGRSKR